ncbi:CRISPR-associated protein Cas5 [Streptomyces carpaticus]|uniref:CRISPR-associated protein Cas5 n=1 Tax=Streptomyces carpaticus TaxID=285558 RepID=A0ABV4ZI05_9ACTN
MSTATRAALQVTVTAPVVSFRDPMYRGVQITLPCPPPTTVGGLLAAAAGGWDFVKPELSFAMSFHARGRGTDLETYHPLDRSGAASSPAPRNRDFLADVTLRIWLFDDIDLWRRRLRRPRWGLRLGRSQDLVGLRLDEVVVHAEPGVLGSALVPEAVTATPASQRLRLASAVVPGNTDTRWGSYRFDPTGRCDDVVPGSRSTIDGLALVPLASPHPATITVRSTAGDR